MPAAVNENRKKRVRTILARLKHHNHQLRERLQFYRHWAIATGGAALILAAVLGFVAAADGTADPVLLGRGMAGLKADSIETVGESSAHADRQGSDVGSGEASYYGDELAGRPTASGELFDPAGLTAAHRTLPLGSQVRVTNLGNGRSVTVRINDRGPFTGNRVIDLSHGAASRLGMLGAGTAMVRLHLIDR